MRQGFTHMAVLAMAPDDDPAAPGAAVTTVLCGHWEHEGPCPVVPHHTGAERHGDELRLRILFAAEPHLEERVRRDIDRALTGGELTGPDGRTSRWRLLSSGPGEPSAQEATHLARLARG
ncbi:hypothetical protein U2F26_10100 [Micromonospora sp. 4G57]|uniref:Uncharacterized protein n=1 Tax=Micromonospora sicca TaxID=2202420 RepID=A0ABU5J6J1_9ACTN|nr:MULTISPECIES: hypothetical protein [unclassified Micromonospora]MDZ5443080.1 hypothetical protein [Micromonospora sp. 4G57]MDZ5488208.1 hypothetical protein [Micromonospora sp. 4G53]